jgi:hypothetical protein
MEIIAIPPMTPPATTPVWPPFEVGRGTTVVNMLAENVIVEDVIVEVVPVEVVLVEDVLVEDVFAEDVLSEDVLVTKTGHWIQYHQVRIIT